MRPYPKPLLLAVLLSYSSPTHTISPLITACRSSCAPHISPVLPQSGYAVAAGTAGYGATSGWRTRLRDRF
ncbi:hypothetical protein CERSUDRAFT_63845 [Gelatoporia subvermispora B]|uniref:Secreted protein n=1 Tax=Ceriporiopsis subvermispora (strain B) TaxID=914234 RepID=M2PQU0_CERS8|nr:hypothetical protein CERSUDRAFT_63845 [Gelatoporia subvermispora B]